MTPSSISSPVVVTEARETGTGREVVDAAGGVGGTEAVVRDASDVEDTVAGVRAGRADTEAIIVV